MSKPYAGAPVTQQFRERWLSGQMVGDHGPVGSVEVRRGRLVHSFHHYAQFGYPAFGDYPGALHYGFWYPDWQVNSDWMILDGIKNIKLDQSFDGNGVTTATIVMDNIKLTEATGRAGILYHLVSQGYYSPLRGYVAPRRPDPGVRTTPYLNMLPNAQIRIRQGYGADEMVTTFLGLIDDVETDSTPNQLTITARDFGGVLVDEVFFGWAKEMLLPSPLTFANRAVVENSQIVGGDARASTTQAGHAASMVTDAKRNTTLGWRSVSQGATADTQWIEITVPAGKYSQLIVGFPYDDMRAMIGIKPTHYVDAQGHDRPPSFDGQSIAGQLDSGGWWDPYATSVPGFFGGWPYFTEIKATTAGPSRFITLGGVFSAGDGTIIRVGLRNLKAIGRGYEAGMNRLQANQRSFNKVDIQGRYVLIDDVSDVVRCCLRWAGFKNWEVEQTGTNFGYPGGILKCDSSMSFMSVINTIKDMVGYTFFIGEPRDDSDDQDLGWPIFRNNRVMEDYSGKTEHIDDKLLLTDAKVTLSNQDDHCIIRCRGWNAKNGVEIDGDSTDRIMFAYIPPWAGEQAAKQAGVLKPITHQDNKFTRLSDCQFGCYLIAIQIALLKYTAIIDLPANPGIGLDTLQSVIDRVQGLNSRLYVTNRSSQMEFGSGGYWTLELGGGLVDTPDMAGVLVDYRAALKVLERGETNPWLRKRHGKLLNYGYQDKAAPGVAVAVVAPQGAIVYRQAEPATVWSITHGLGRIPIVAVYDAAGNLRLAQVSNPDLNTTVVTWDTPQAGTVVLA